MFGLRKHFMLDPGIIYLNHGSFGAVPRVVFKAYQQWQRELENQPVEFINRRLPSLMSEARAELGCYLGTHADNVVYVTNVTIAVNIVAQSLDLGPGDEVLSTDQEYGACNRIWRYYSQQRGFRYIQQPIPIPVESSEIFLETLWKAVTPHTRLIFISHLTSPTALILPVAAVCKRAKVDGILTLVDGAHAPGQIPLDVEQVGADFYCGNLHKWLCAPKGAGFLYATKTSQDLLDPFVVSWGYESESPGPSRFIDHHEYWGTRDPAAFLSVPEAITFQAEHGWEKVRSNCHALAQETQHRICRLFDQEPLANETWFSQMVSVPIRESTDPENLQRTLYDEFDIEVLCMERNGKPMMRISLQGYNNNQDVNKLVDALRLCDKKDML